MRLQAHRLSVGVVGGVADLVKHGEEGKRQKVKGRRQKVERRYKDTSKKANG